MNEPHTHPVPETISREEAGADVIALAERLCPLPLSNEALWKILSDALEQSYRDGYDAGLEDGEDVAAFRGGER